MKVFASPAPLAVAMAIAAMTASIGVHAADEPTVEPGVEVTATPAPPPAKPINVKTMFAMNCSWCHDGYGLHAGKGPKLAGTQMTAEQVYLRIAKGKSGMMPGFEKTLSKDQIDAFVAYIKGLKDPDS